MFATRTDKPPVEPAQTAGRITADVIAGVALAELGIAGAASCFQSSSG